MKKLIPVTLIIIGMMFLSAGLGYESASYHRIHITRQVTDERGLISVQYIQDGKEWAEDYLTEDEYLRLVNQ